MRQEALLPSHSFDARYIQKLIPAQKIVVHSVNKKEVHGVMTEFRLDEGEAAAYVLSDKKKHNAIFNR